MTTLEVGRTMIVAATRGASKPVLGTADINALARVG